MSRVKSRDPSSSREQGAISTCGTGNGLKIEDMDITGFRLHELAGRSHARWTISVSGNWRLTVEFRDGDVYLLDYEDYHQCLLHNPPHPGELIREIYLEPYDLSIRSLSESLGVSASTLTRIINGQSGISPEMALRLSKAVGRSAESWLAMQHIHDLWKAKQSVDLSRVTHDRICCLTSGST